MRYEVRTSIVQVIGNIWQPGIGLCTYQYTLSPYNVENCQDDLGAITRESVQQWLDCNAGDFQKIVDFWASIEHGDSTVEIPWATEEGELAYLEATCEL